MATILGNLDNMLREELGPGVREMLPEIDPIFSKINSSSIGVSRDEIGRGYQVKHTFVTSLAGAYKWQAALASDVSASPSTSVMYDNTTIRAFPTHTEATNPGIITRTITLTQGAGTIVFPLTVLQIDTMSSAVIKYVAKTMKLVAQLVAQTNAVSFYASDSYKSLGTIDTMSTDEADDGSTDTYKARFTLDEGRIRRFYPGMLVDVYDSTGTTNRLAGQTYYAVVHAVDYLNKQVTLITSGAVTNYWITAVESGDVIVPHGGISATVGLGPSGLEDWAVEPDAVGESADPTLYGIHLNNYPQLGSLVGASVGSVTESILNKYIGGFDDAYAGMCKLDTIITTGGVVREMLDQVQDLRVFQRNGTPLNMENGWADIGYQYNGRSFKWLISPYCSAETLYGLKLGDKNITRYVPNKIPKSGSEKNFDGEVQFFAPLGGSSGIFMHAHNSSGAVTEFVQAPFFTTHELAPNYPQMIKLTGCTELNP